MVVSPPAERVFRRPSSSKKVLPERMAAAETPIPSDAFEPVFAEERPGEPVDELMQEDRGRKED